MALTQKNIVSKILDLTKKIGSDWKDELYAIGIYENVRTIYDMYSDRIIGNTLVAFVILAYSNESDWIVVHEDRMKNKYNILKRLGLSEDTLKDDLWCEVVSGDNTPTNIVSKWFLDWQKDSRWSTFISKKKYYSENLQFVNTPINPTREVSYRGEISTVMLSDTELLKAKKLKGELLSEAQEQEQGAMELYAEMEDDFVTLNAIANKEQIPKITDSKSITFESMIHRRGNKKN